MLEYFNLSQKDLLDIYILLSNNRFNRIDYPFAYTGEDADYKISLRAKNAEFDSKMYLTISKWNEKNTRVIVKDIELSQTKGSLLARVTRGCCESMYNSYLDICCSKRFYKNFETVIIEGLAKCQKWISKTM